MYGVIYLFIFENVKNMYRVGGWNWHKICYSYFFILKIYIIHWRGGNCLFMMEKNRKNEN